VPTIEPAEAPRAAPPRPDLRADAGDHVPSRSGRSFRIVVVAGLVAFAAGAGILYGSFGAITRVDRANPAAESAAPVAAEEAVSPADPAQARSAEAEPTPSSVESDPASGGDPSTEAASADAAPAERAAAAEAPAPEPAKAASRETMSGKPAASLAATPAPKPAEKTAPQKVTAKEPSAKEPSAAPVPGVAAGTVAAAIPRLAARRPADPDVVAPAPDDGRFLSDVEQALADAPPAAAEPDSAALEPVGPPVALNAGPDRDWSEPNAPAAAVPKRLQPPADIPDTEDAYPVDSRGQDEWLDEPGMDDFGGLRPLRHWAVVGVQNGRAIVDGRRRGVFMVEPGSYVPDLGTIQAIRRQGDRWIVVTSRGVILPAADMRAGRL
jgi:hypothetical protein